jgi:hypothetical protein
MEALDLIPTDNRTIEAKVLAFNNMDSSIRNNFADILLATMEIYFKLYGDLKSIPSTSPAYDGGREQVMIMISFA